MNQLQLCSTCHNPAGHDAVVLRNGCLKCQTCFHRDYSPPVKTEAPSLSIISIEGVLAVVLLIGCLGGMIMIYRNQQETAAAEKREREKSEAAAAKKADDEREFYAARRAKIELDTRAAEAKRDADARAYREVLRLEAEALRVKSEQRAAERQLLDAKHNAEYESKILEVVRTAALNKQEREQKEQVDQAREFSAVTEMRSKEIADISAEYKEQVKLITKLEAVKVRIENNIKIDEVVYNGKKQAYEALKAKYSAVPYSRIYVQIGVSNAVQDTEAIQISANMNKAANDANFAWNEHTKEKGKLSQVDWELQAAKVKLDEIKRKLPDTSQLDVGTPSPATATTVESASSVRKPGFSTLYKKDGKTLQVTGVIKANNEVRFRDDRGDSYTLSADDVVKIEKNN
ncbi:MAG: hypothetical protein WCT04_26715 [Planctomycetota bacterium]